MTKMSKLFAASAKRVWSYVIGLPKLYTLGAVIVVFLGLVGLHFLTRSAPPADATPAGISHVSVSSVMSLSSQTGPLSVTGDVKSLSQATILAQSAGEIVTLSNAIGDYVPTGAIIARLENSSQEAAVLQAQGAYEVAQSALANAVGATAANSGVSANQASQSEQNSASAVNASILSMYAALDDAVHTKADLLFDTPRSISPTLLLTVPDNQLVITLQSERTQLELTLASANTLAEKSSRTDIDADSAAMTADAQSTLVFINNLITAINEAVPNGSISSSNISSFQASIGTARTEITGAISSLAAAKTAYDSAVAIAITTGNTAGSGTDSNIATAQANLKEAQGALDAAQANLEKTIIRSPISGDIVSLSITQGDYVPAFSQVAQVSNPQALEVDAYVTSDEAKTLQVGGKAILNNDVQGVITSIAPALDPTTGKILVKIGIVGSSSTLTDGETISVDLARSDKPTTDTGTSLVAIVIPIISVKILPQGPVVFTVNASSTLDAHPIVLGSILGDQVQVISGLVPQLDIVTDARGLAEGQTVIVDTQ